MATPEREVRMENKDSKGDDRDSKKRKKKRRAAESSSNEKQKSSANAQDGEKADNDVPSKRLKRSRPLAGKVIAVTTLAESSAESSPENFSNVMNLCKEAGAKPSNQVHKKTFCLVASESAVAGETQRVRKAWKKGIPVVDVAWVRQCVEDGCLRPFGEFLVGSDPSTRKRKVAKEVTEQDWVASVKDSDNPLQEGGWSEGVELGCCCSCHDTDTGVTDCEWCLECSVNTALKVKQQITSVQSPSIVSKSDQASSSKIKSKATTGVGTHSTEAQQEKEKRKLSETPEEKKMRRQEKKEKKEKNKLS
jgi:hypothetical protein